MANSRFQYVRKFEMDDALLPATWLVVRLDGRGFHKFSSTHNFEKPNDKRALDLMNKCALSLMAEFGDIVIGYGQSDEYSFVLHSSTTLYGRRASKIQSTFVSIFTSCYVFHWAEYFPAVKLEYPPSFDARVVCYPTVRILRDYLSWRQADCHINNLYNTCFWALVQKGSRTTQQAEKELCGTFSKDKNEILFSQFGINYNSVPEIYRKGSIPVRLPAARDKDEGNEAEVSLEPTEEGRQDNSSVNGPAGKGKTKRKRKDPLVLQVVHEDIISDDFWNKYSHILNEQ